MTSPKIISRRSPGGQKTSPAAQHELTPGADRQKTVPACALFVIQQVEGARLALRFGREVHVKDGRTVDLAPWAPPPSSHHRHRRGRCGVATVPSRSRGRRSHLALESLGGCGEDRLLRVDPTLCTTSEGRAAAYRKCFRFPKQGGVNGFIWDSFAVHRRIETPTSCACIHALLRLAQVRNELIPPRNCWRIRNSCEVK